MVAEVESHRRARRTNQPHSRLIRTIVAFALAIASVGAVASPALADAPTATTASDGFAVSVSALNGGVLAPGQPLTVEMVVSNTGAATIIDGTLSVWINPTQFSGRSDLTSWLAGTGQPSGSVLLGSIPSGEIQPGDTIVRELTVPAGSAGLPSGATDASFGIGSSLSIGPTATAFGRNTLVWNAGATATRTNVSVAMPITVPASTSGLISSADLALYTAPTGILTRDLDGLVGHPDVAIAIDPMIIASIRVLGNAAPPTATTWLETLQSEPNDIFPLAYGDADVTGQLQAGLKAPLPAPSLSFALNPRDFPAGTTPVAEPTPTSNPSVPTPSPTANSNPALPTNQELLAWQYTMTDVAWPGDDTVRTADLAALASSGLKTTLVSSSNTNLSATSSTTPNPAISVGNSRAVMFDAGISAAVQAAAAATTDAAWNHAMSQANAQLQLISAQQNSAPATVLVVLGREAPSSGTQLARTFSSLSTSPWETPITFGQALATTPTSGLAVKDSPESSVRIHTISQLLNLQQQVDAFATVLDDPMTMTGQTRAELLTVLGVAWQNPRNDWASAVARSVKASNAILTSVSILKTDNVNLVGTQGSIPFTVDNALPNEAVTVVVEASPSNGRLEIDGPVTKTVQADSRATVLVPVKAELGNGQVTLTLELTSKTGVVIGEPTTVPVQVHADWEGIGALIVGALLVLLFGFGVVRNITRRRRQGSDDDPDDTAAITEPGASVTDDTDPAPDTPVASDRPGTPAPASAEEHRA